MRRLIAACLAMCLAAPVLAQDAVPDRRVVVTRDVDFYGSDLQALFDTTFEACQRVCLNDARCGAFTFNARSNACFPKTAVTDRQPYDGAVSGIVVATPPALRAQATGRAGELGFLRDGDIARARDEAAALGPRHEGGQWGADALVDAARRAEASGDIAGALQWTGAALAQTDGADLWLDYGRLAALRAGQLSGADARRLHDRATLAAINGYLRAGPVPQRQAALLALARGFEATGRGRDMIPALRLAEALGPRPDITAALDDAIAKFGFRIVEHVVEADSAAPRICAVFSETLIRAGQDYAPFVRLPDPRLAVTSDDSRICVTGVEHGSRYTLTFRAGLPSAEGEALLRDVPITAYIRDRAPAVGFPGRAYVLPRSADAGLPVETVNLSEVALTLRRVSDRNLIRAMQEDLFARPLNQWQIERFDTDLAEEIWTGTAEVENRLNADVLTRLPMGEVVGDLPAGIYVLSAAVPAADPYDDPGATQWFVLSDIGLTSLAGSDGLTVIARALGDASAIAGLEVTLVSRANRVLAEARTDAQGVVRFAPGLIRGQGGAVPAMILARRGDADLAFLSLQGPAFDLSDRGVAGRAPAGPIDAFLATDRGAYRAGETIHATALLRDAQAAAIGGVPVTAVLTRPDGVEHARTLSAQGIEGGHVFALPLDPAVPRGTWRLAIYADPQGAPLTSQSLLVEDFVPERIEVDLALPEGPIRADAPPQMDLTARYLFGAPGADLPIEGDLRLVPRDRLEALPRWRFGRHDAGLSPVISTLPGGLVTDADGRARIALSLPDLPDDPQPMAAEITVRVAEGSARPVERRITRPVAPPAPMIGIRPDFDDTLPEGAEARFALQAFGPDLSPAPMDAAWTLNRIETRYQWYQLYGNWNWEPVTTRTTVATGTARLGAEPVTVAADVTWGRYELVVERTDGAYASASVGFDAGWYAPADALDTPDMLALSLDRERYRPGDTATLRIVPRHAGQALITVLTDRVVAMQAVEVTAGETLIDLPVTEDWGTGAYVTAELIRPMDVAAGQGPARALGLAHAAMDPGDRQLAVTLDAPADTAPRGPLRVGVDVAGLAGGETAYVTLAAVDLGILNLTGFDAPDPSAHYFGQRRLGVEIRDLYGRLIDGMNGAMGRIRSGGDAEAQMRMQSPPPTEALVAFFSGPVTVGPTGRAEVAFDLPDFNGTVRLMAIAWSPRGVGQASADVLVRDPVVVSAALPRFLAPGDTSRLRLDLTHVTGPAGEMALDVTAAGLSLDTSALPATVSLAEGGRATVDLPLAADALGDHRIEIALTTPAGQRLTKSLTLGVRANDPPVSVTRRLTLAAGETFTLDRNVLAGFDPASASLLVSAGPLARFDVPGLLAALDRYPYGCTEQITSQALPLLYLSGIAEPLGLGNAGRLAARIDRSIAAILTRQAGNGAFGLWRAGSGDFWLDAYVTDFLSRAHAAGRDVPDRAFASALDNLANRIAYAPDFDTGGEDIAYALMVLAREGRATMGDLRYYADVKAEAFATPLALAQLGAALASYGDQMRADALFARAARRIAGQAGDEPAEWRADYGTPLRDAAGLLTLAVDAGSDVVDTAGLVMRISASAGRLSTQEQAWALLAAHALVRDPAVSGMSVDGAPVTGPFVRRYDGASLAPMAITNNAASPTDLTITTLGQPTAMPEPTGFGYAIERQWYDLDGNPISGPLSVGDRLVAVLTVRPAEATGARLMIDDPLPAGLEIDNPALLRAGDIRALDWLEVAETDHAEFRTDRFLAAVTQAGAEPIRLAYILRAVSPGAFHHPPALVEDMYRPDYRATTAAGRLTVTP